MRELMTSHTADAETEAHDDAHSLSLERQTMKLEQ